MNTKKVIRSIVFIAIFTIVLFMICYAFYGQVAYRAEKRREKLYIEHAIEQDILAEYNNETCILGFAIADCYGADGHSYLIDVFIEENGGDNPLRIDKWWCYVSAYQCDCDYVGTIYLEEVEI